MGEGRDVIRVIVPDLDVHGVALHLVRVHTPALHVGRVLAAGTHRPVSTIHSTTA
jgi:hypothetical protein